MVTHTSLLGAQLLCMAVWITSLALSAHGASCTLVPTEFAPRAVFVALVHEGELQPMLSSIRQLEDSFNKHYLYDWVFFSTVPLSDEFRRLTSNATNATCLYEVAQQSRLGASGGVVDGAAEAFGAEYGAAGVGTPLLGQIHGWKSGRFANERRLKDYDWFWRVEPGVRLALSAAGVAYLEANGDDGVDSVCPRHPL